MRTVGYRAPSGEKSVALCDRCGTRWPRSKLFRDAEGLLNCPQEGTGRDALTLTRANVASAKAYSRSYGHPQRFPGSLDKESTSTEEALQEWEPTNVPGYVLNLNPYQNVFTTTNALGVTVVKCFGSVVGKNNSPFINATLSAMPAWEADGWFAPTSGASRPSLLFDGVNDYLECVNSIGGVLTGGDDKPFTVFVVAQLVSLAAGSILAPLISTGKLSNSGGALWNLSQMTGAWWTQKRGDTGLVASVSGGTADTDNHIFDVNHTGTGVTLSIDGEIIVAGPQNVVPLTGIDAMTLGKSTRTSGTNSLCNYRLARVLGFNGEMSELDLIYVRSKLTEIYF